MTPTISPYLQEAVRRAALIPSTPKRENCEEYNPAYYRYRYSNHLGPVEIENPLPPVESWGHEIKRALCFAAAIIAIWWSWQQMFGG